MWRRGGDTSKLWHDSLTGKTSVSRAGNFLVQVQVMSQNKIFGGRYVARNWKINFEGKKEGYDHHINSNRNDSNFF